ncbi:MAG: S1 RNA-binding domain-containing protein [Ardenticatenaceae bacterium]|nr:S1 RNA-binding domain-containing protein [Ardenticatenaceae bacterium]
MLSVSSPYTINQRVAVTADKLLPYGVFVHLDDGTRACIRRRELSWAGDADPRTLVHAGQRLEATVLDLASPGRIMELSLKATLADPWERIRDEFHVGDVVAGTVRNLVPYGAFVELLPGAQGLVPLDELGREPVERPEHLVWLDDDVEAVVTHIDLRHRKITLSIRQRLKQQARVSAVMNTLARPSDETAPPQRTGALSTGGWELTDPGGHGREAATADREGIARVGRVLIVDDHREISDPLVAWLRHHGYVADAANQPADALGLSKTHQYGLVLMDLDLSDTDGLTLIRQIMKASDTLRIAVMSSAGWLEERAHEIEALEVVEVFVKPLDLREIDLLLLKIRCGGPLPRWRVAPSAPRTVEEHELFDLLAPGAGRGTSLAERLEAGLAQLLERTQAEIAIIFQQDRTSQAISILATSDTATLAPEALYSLRRSPVRDVIREGDPVVESHISRTAEGRFRKLLDLLPFESCIGVPVEVEGEVHHALFLFHSKPHAFHRDQLRDALISAVLFAALLNREALSRRMQESNRLLLTGQLAAGFGHEMYNKMSGLEIQLRNLQADYDRLERERYVLTGPVEFKEAGHKIDRLVEAARDLHATAELFQRLMRSDAPHASDVNLVVQRAATLLRPMARRCRIQILFEPDPALARGNAIHLQQVFLNIMLNAIQHTAVKSRDSGTLEITVACNPHDPTVPLKVRFTDTGPGIHKQLWEKIFALGFSTRSDGTGLGLYVARSLVASLQGRITVEHSTIPVGTVFLVELPAASPQEEAG